MTSSVDDSTSQPPQVVTSPVQVFFEDGLEWNDIPDRLKTLRNPEVVFWFIGTRGLKEGSCKFYKENITTIVREQPSTRINLFDITGWRSFYDKKCGFMEAHKTVEKVNTFGLKNLRAISSSTVFSGFMSVTDVTELALFHEILNSRTFVDLASEDRKDNGRTVAQVFKDKCPILKPIYEFDTARKYSMIQYLEGMFLVREFVLEMIKTNTTRDIVFALPNDENKYYRDEATSFKTDIEAFLRLQLKEKFYKLNVRIFFLNFKYSTESNHRPYNAPGANIKKFEKSDIIISSPGSPIDHLH